jgi:hypothetical protein
MYLDYGIPGKESKGQMMTMPSFADSCRLDDQGVHGILIVTE